MISIYPILHLLVDGICALSMYSYFMDGDKAMMYILLYNLCAFALQMPFGVIADMLPGRRRYDKEKHCMYLALIGVLVTIAGSFFSPIILGIGNALFHVGGGTAAVHDDKWKNRRGLGLGLFVAPGALGLFLGSTLYNSEDADLVFLTFRLLSILLCLGLVYVWYYHSEERKVQTKLKLFDPIQIKKYNDDSKKKEKPVFAQKFTKGQAVMACVLCLLVVIIRSYVGLAVNFSWKEGVWLGVMSALYVCFGKVFGGFLGSKLGLFWTSAISLCAAAICFVFADVQAVGLLAQLLFNMTMPITLTLLAQYLPGKEGFSFGFLSFGLFVGFLPAFFGLTIPNGCEFIAGIMCVLSLVLLLPVLRPENKAKSESSENTEAK
ncbi:MAG: hypothetical protein KBS85_05945 [Lachnospiraceae bacterium]|nr:hypothetical protein [Candidatus Merdinaster equi]